MGTAVVTIKLMPKSPEIDLEDILDEAKSHIEDFTSKKNVKSETESVAFGLKALKLTFMMDEELGSPEELEKTLGKVQGVQSAETVDVRRAVG